MTDPERWISNRYPKERTATRMGGTYGVVRGATHQLSLVGPSTRLCFRTLFFVQFVALAEDILFYSFGGALAGATGNVYDF